MFVSTCVYIYTHIHREKVKERKNHKNKDKDIGVCIYMYVYIYIYIHIYMSIHNGKVMCSLILYGKCTASAGITTASGGAFHAEMQVLFFPGPTIPETKRKGILPRTRPLQEQEHTKKLYFS